MTNTAARLEGLSKMLGTSVLILQAIKVAGAASVPAEPWRPDIVLDSK
ncbi:MAG: hypothetical protein GVY36_05410 [Verrucomicrobia bacterium]|nr:hypothetical protein [Verrucomicrobiota bacterium]